MSKLQGTLPALASLDTSAPPRCIADLQVVELIYPRSVIPRVIDFVHVHTATGKIRAGGKIKSLPAAIVSKLSGHGWIVGIIGGKLDFVRGFLHAQQQHSMVDPEAGE